MSQTYSPAPEVKKIAEDLITEHHTHLSTIRIEYIFAHKPIKERSREVWGRARKVGGLSAWLAGRDQGYDASEPEEFFVIEISETVWFHLDDKSKRALVDHELCHCDVDIDTSKLSMNPHSLEEFTEIVQRHGLWREDVKRFVATARQKPLFDDREVTKVTLIHDGREVDATNVL